MRTAGGEYGFNQQLKRELLNTNANVSAAQNLSEVPRPQNIADMMKERGEQDEAKPTLVFVEPKDGATVNSSTVKVKLNLAGDLKGYKPMKDMTTEMENHIHVILDNQPYEAYYNLGQEFELRNVADGEHTLRVFPSRPWHESYKNDGAFQMVKFTVADGGADSHQTDDDQRQSDDGERQHISRARRQRYAVFDRRSSGQSQTAFDLQPTERRIQRRGRGRDYD